MLLTTWYIVSAWGSIEYWVVILSNSLRGRRGLKDLIRLEWLVIQSLDTDDWTLDDRTLDDRRIWWCRFLGWWRRRPMTLARIIMTAWLMAISKKPWSMVESVLAVADDRMVESKLAVSDDRMVDNGVNDDRCTDRLILSSWRVLSEGCIDLIDGCEIRSTNNLERVYPVLTHGAACNTHDDRMRLIGWTVVDIITRLIDRA